MQSSADKQKQAGFGVVEAIVAIVIVALVVAVGWVVYQRVNQDQDSGNDETSAQVEEAPQVENGPDLTESEQYLKDLDIDNELDTSELDEAIGA